MRPSDSPAQQETRLTLVIGNLGAGGAERNLVRLAEALADRGFAVTLLTLNQLAPDFYPVAENVRRVQADSAAEASPRWFDLRGQARRRAATRHAILDTQPHLVISFIDTVNITVLGTLRGSGVPVIASERIDWRAHTLNWRWHLLRRLIYPTAARVVCLARAPVLSAQNYWPRWRCVHIANPVPALSDSQAQRPAWFGPRNLIAVGRLTHQKGFDLLLQAFAANADLDDWHLTILGEGPDRVALTAQAEALDLAPRVHLPGTVADPFPLLKAADLFVFSSRYEAFGMALAEAMACGLPVIAFDCPSGPADIVRNGVDGLLVPPEDVLALAAAMRQLMEDPDSRARLAAQAPTVVDRFSPERIYGQWEALVHEVLSEHGEAH